MGCCGSEVEAERPVLVEKKKKIGKDTRKAKYAKN